jgi:5S rRNA maturation endonuclease (ribonuclease M5)/KaiC/GvpD/RAD55 family RecA-like ATPase
MNMQDFLSRLQKVSKTSKGWQACCPSHADTTPSLSVDEGEKGIVLTCRAGCDTEKVVAAMGLKMSDLFRDSSKEVIITPIKRQVVESYVYTDALGKPLFRTCRIEPGKDGRKKDFAQQGIGADGKYQNNMEGMIRVLYNLPAVLKSEQVVICEGERKANWINETGYVATCNVGGAGKWLDAWTDCLAGKSIVICADNDEPGQNHARLLHKALSGHVKEILHIRVPKPHNDIVDYFRSVGMDKDTRTKAFIDLLMAGMPVPQNLDVPIRSMAQLEEEYIAFIAKSSNTVLLLGNWLPAYRTLRGIVPGEMVTIISDTGVGKTMVLHNIALSASPLYVLLFELELPSSLTFERLAALTTECSGYDIESFYKSTKPVHWQRNEQVKRIFTCSESNLSVEKIREILHKAELAMGVKPAVVMIDYIQLMQGRGSRYEKTSDVAEQLKVLAKEENVILILASQVSRDGSEQITLHSSKDSGAIENSSGCVLGAWRDEHERDSIYIKLLKFTKGRAGEFAAVKCTIDRSLRIKEAMPFDKDDPR